MTMLWLGRAVTAGFLVLLLLGCGSGDRNAQRLDPTDDALRDIAATQRTCRAAIFAKPACDSIAQRLPVMALDTNSEHLPDPDRVRPGERRLVAALFSESLRCRGATMERVATLLPELVPTMIEQETEGDRIRARLLNGEIGWGETNTHAASQAAAFRTRSQQVVRASQVRVPSEAEAAERRQAALTLVRAHIASAGGSLASVQSAPETAPARGRRTARGSRTTRNAAQP